MIGITLKKILNHQSSTILSAGLLMSILTFCGSILGLVRNALLASKFGASLTLDIYYASFRLPDLIYNIFILGAISVAFIPLFNEFLSQDTEKAWQFTSVMFIGIGLLFGFLSILITIFAHPLLSMILRGFKQEDILVAVRLTRIMMLQPLLLGISSIITGALRSFRLFFITALAPLMYNIGIIIGIIFLSYFFNLNGLAWGVVLGAFLHLLIQIPSLWHLKYRFNKPNFNYFRSQLKTIISLSIARSSSIIISQLFLLGITSLATYLQEGTISIVTFVDSILPYTTFALPFADAAFPYLAKVEAEHKSNEFLEIFARTLRQILFFIIPLAFWCVVFREPIVRLLLGYGKFNWQATIITARVLSIMAIGMIFQSINYYLLKVFFAKKNAIFPFISSVISYSFGFIICTYLARKFDILGLASGMVLTYFIYTLVLFIFSHQYINYYNVQIKNVYSIIMKIFFISVISSAGGYLLFNILSHFLLIQKVKNLIINSLISGLSTVLIFYILANIWQIPEIKEVARIIKGRMRKKYE